MSQFSGSRMKLEDAQNSLAGMEGASDAARFRAAFNSFLSAARAVTNGLQKEGAHVEGFKEWYEAKQQEMKADELLRFFHQARVDDFHRGKHQLVFGTYVETFRTDQVGPPPFPGAKLAGYADGWYWLVDAGTPRERRIPVHRGGKWVVSIAVTDPPTSHRGKSLKEQDPISLCRLTAKYLSELVHEARTKFP